MYDDSDNEDTSEVKWVVVYDPLDVPGKAPRGQCNCDRPVQLIRGGKQVLTRRYAQRSRRGLLSAKLYRARTAGVESVEHITEDHTTKGMKVLR